MKLLTKVTLNDPKGEKPHERNGYVDERQAERYNDIMSNIRPLMVVGNGRNQRMLSASAMVPVSCCYVDERYQGLRSHKHLNKLISKWDMRKLTPIILVLSLTGKEDL